jgi:hypothetical protein
MRVLVLARSFPITVRDDEVHDIRNLFLHLLQRGDRVSVATLWRPGLEFEEEGNGVNIYRVRGTKDMIDESLAQIGQRFAPHPFDLELLRELGQVILRENPDFVHANYWSVPFSQVS